MADAKRVAPGDGDEVAGHVERIEQQPRHALHLVGAHGELDAGGLKLVEQRQQPFERPAADGDVAPVVVEIAREQRLVLGGGHALGRRPHGALDHVPRAVADERAQRPLVDARQPQVIEHVVGRRDEVRRRVDKGAVEVEDEGQVAHRSSNSACRGCGESRRGAAGRVMYLETRGCAS